MWMSKIVEYGTDILLTVIAIWLFFYYFDIFLIRRKEKGTFVVGISMLIVWQLGIGNLNDLFPAFLNVMITVGFTLLGSQMIYEGKLWNKCVFSCAFSAVWMLMETLSGYLFLIYCNQFTNLESMTTLGALVSKGLLLIVVMALKKVFSDDKVKELPYKYSVMLVLIPIGSIYIMNNIFMLSYDIDHKQTNMRSAITVVIFLGLNVLIFYIYIKLADILQLRRMTSVYEQQLELCERHQQEREMSTLQLRDVRHNMKNHLISILAYAHNGDCDKVISFVNEVMEDGGIKRSTITNSGNIVIDSLIGYWYASARSSDIDFSVDLSIPMQMIFKGSDLCLILGNLLENAVEATRKLEGKRYIRIQMKYDKNNLLIYVMNNYKGPLVKSKYNTFKSTKKDAANHGVGLPSVCRAVEKYKGTVVVDDSVLDRFSVKIVLYGN